MFPKLFGHKTVRNGIESFAQVPQVCAQWDYSRPVRVEGRMAQSLVRWAVFHGHTQDTAVRVVKRIYGATTSRRAFELALTREASK